MGNLLTTASVLQCPHGGIVTITSSNTTTKAGGAYLALASDLFTIAGCPLNVAGAPHPCLTVQWTTPAGKSAVMGQPTLTTDSVGLCLAGDQTPQGPVLISATQPLVAGE